MNVPLALFTAEPPKRDATLGEQVYKQLCELLISGQLAPGDRRSLRTAAEILGVSVLPVREAVSRLVSDGGLEVAPNRAVRVPIMSSEQFRDLTPVSYTHLFRHLGDAACRERKTHSLRWQLQYL